MNDKTLRARAFELLGNASDLFIALDGEKLQLPITFKLNDEATVEISHSYRSETGYRVEVHVK